MPYNLTLQRCMRLCLYTVDITDRNHASIKQNHANKNTTDIYTSFVIDYFCLKCLCHEFYLLHE